MRLQESMIVKRIFIASPRDLEDERRLFPGVLDRLNRVKCNTLGMRLEPLGWENSQPGMGRAQALINRDVERCDLFVMLLWKWWGTAPSNEAKYSSGTEEEFELAHSLHRNRGTPEIFLYLRDIPEDVLADPGEQLRRVLGFRKKIENERALLYKRYSNAAHWEAMLMENIAGWLDDMELSSAPYLALPTEAFALIRDQQRQIRELKIENQSTETKLRAVVLDYGRRAADAARDGRLTEAEELFCKAIQTYPERAVINAFAHYCLQIGSLGRAENKFKYLVRVGRESADRKVLAMGYFGLGRLYQSRGDLDAAEDAFRKSLELLNSMAHGWGTAASYGSLGIVLATRGDLRGAERMLEEALAVHKRHGQTHGMVLTYSNLAFIYCAMRDEAKAEQMLDRSIELSQAALGPGYNDTLAYQASMSGLIYLARGQLKDAEDRFRQSLHIFEELGNMEGMSLEYNNLGLTYQRQEDFEASEQMLHKALIFAERVRHKQYTASALLNLGKLSKVRGDDERARDYLLRSKSLFDRIGCQLESRDAAELLHALT